MKILVVCQYYTPEPFRVSDICEELVHRGHDVTVVTGIPNYPMGEIYDEYAEGKRRDEVIGGVKVHRCFEIARKRGKLYRFLNYYSFMLSSTRYVKKLRDDFDVVFVNQLSPIMMANAGVKYKKKNNVPLVMYCLDLWPESLTLGGIGKKSIFYKFFHKVSGKIYNEADRLFISSKSFSDYFEKEFGITDAVYLPQYAEKNFLPDQCRKVPNRHIDLMFAGNVGIAQSVKTIVEAASLTADIPNLRWHIVGDGSETESLKNMAGEAENIIFHDRKPSETMPKYYAMADAMLVTMKKDAFLSMTLPGKVQSYMAAGKPILGAADGETSVVIGEAGCGLCSEAENAEALANNVRVFIGIDANSLGENAWRYYNENFRKSNFIDELERAFKSSADAVNKSKDGVHFEKFK